MHFENLISNLNNELDKIRSGLKECLKNTQLNKDEIEVNLTKHVIIIYFIINLKKK
jgi:hypothetical protein